MAKLGQRKVSQQLPRVFWVKRENQKLFCDWLTEELNIKQKSDWYRVGEETFNDYGGQGLLLQYGSSTGDALSNIYPDYDWIPWLFKKVPQYFWENLDNQKR